MARKRKKGTQKFRRYGGERYWLDKKLSTKFQAQRYARLCRLDGHNARIAKVGKKWHVYESHHRSKKWKKRYGR